MGGAGDAVRGPGDDADDGVDEAADDGKGVRDGVNDTFSFVGCCPFVGLMPLLTMTLAVGDLLQNRKSRKLSDVCGIFRPGSLRN
jgi:hypothetical protein